MISATAFGMILVAIGITTGGSGMLLGPAWYGDPYAWCPPVRYIVAALLIGVAVSCFVYGYAFLTVEDSVHATNIVN